MKKSELSSLLKEVNENYETEIKNLPFKKKQREDLIAGFRDGARSAVIVLQQKGHLQVEED